MILKKIRKKILDSKKKKQTHNSKDNFIDKDQITSNWADHKILLSDKREYYYEEALNKAYSRSELDPRLVAFYLPQFHPIKENDKAWGTGFTEWTNVRSAQPRFVGHQQPILPTTDLGFYDLRHKENIDKQIKLAKKHGLYGLCFYYYWFSGKKLLDKPLNIFLKNKEWDFNFMICWANENWTKKWDGQDKDVIIEQKYLDSDPLNFIKDVEHILLDPRYIRRNDKPVLIVYRGSLLRDAEDYAQIWRKYFHKKHRLDLELVTMLNFEPSDPREYGFDTGIEFEPLTVSKISGFHKNNPYLKNIQKHRLDPDFRGDVLDYRLVALDGESKKNFNFPTYKTASPSWDNDARRKGQGSLIFYADNPDIYGNWLDSILQKEVKKHVAPLIFINAWNEWAEGAVMEPTQHKGYAVLNRTTEILSKYSNNTVNQRDFPLFGIHRASNTKLAVIVHVFYEEEWKYIEKKIKNALSGVEYDLFITITEQNADLIYKIKQNTPKAFIKIVPNRGRDVLPFLIMANRVKKLGYLYILKLHTKKSTHRKNGNLWFKELIDKLIANKESVANILRNLERNAYFIGPSGHYVSLGKYIGSNNLHLRKYIANFYGEKKAQEVIENQDQYGFFAGSMFWCRIDAIKFILETYPIPEDFESEQGQIDGTLAHSMERLISLVPALERRGLYECSASKINKIGKPINKYKFAPSRYTNE